MKIIYGRKDCGRHIIAGLLTVIAMYPSEMSSNYLPFLSFFSLSCSFCNYDILNAHRLVGLSEGII
jgi:hypothetical protein